MTTPRATVYRKTYGGGFTLFKRGLGAVLLLLITLGPGRAADGIRILALGDSLTAGYGLAEADSFPAQLQTALRARGYKLEVLNAGVSGDTTAGGLARLDWALSDGPDLVIVALGANDGLRGVDPQASRANLAAIMEKLKQRELPVLLVGMLAPPNLGQTYGDAFNAIYPELAEQYQVALYPFFLEGVATDPELNQADGIHPNAEGVALIVKRMVSYLVPLLEQIR